MKLISFSLWGDNPKYTEGAIKNAHLASEIYPGWTCRFYLGESVSSIVAMRLEMCDNTEVVRVPEWGDWRGMFWRFWPASEENVEVVIARDTDCRLNVREKAAVDAWLSSDKGFHIMRDHPFHAFPVLGGMWGAKRGCLSNMKQLTDEWDQQDRYGTDYEFFQYAVMPLIQDDALVHDDFFNKGPLVQIQGCSPTSFPHARHELEFVGEVYDESDNTVKEHTAVLKNYLEAKNI
jgi:protein O-GlcNAc transferase